jgi:hypothetical protein
MNLNEFFPHQVCINLDKRPDRWERIQARFVEHSLDQVVRFPALDGNSLKVPSGWPSFPGAYGCLRSHLEVVEQAREQARPNVLIFEDDAVLAPGFNTRFAGYVQQLPQDWDMVFFGAIHGQPLTRITDNIIRVTHSLSTYAYAVRHTIYDAFIEVNRKAPSVLDENTRSLQKRFNCYCFMPHLAWVEEDYSDVRPETINLWWLKESLVLFGPEIDEVLRNTAVIISYRNSNQNSLRNLRFAIEYLAQTLPGIALSVLERGHEASLIRSDLPAGCQLEFLPDSGSGHSKYSFMKRGFEAFGFKDFFLFLDSDIFLTRDDIKANLLKCREYDFASCFREIYDLTETETLQILAGDVRWDHRGPLQSRRKAAICDSSCIVTQRGMRLLAANENANGVGTTSMPARVEQLLRVYESPNLARLLSSG